MAANDAGSADMVVTINVHNSFINSASLGTSGTSGVIAGVITALLIFVVLAGLALFYVMNKVTVREGKAVMMMSHPKRVMSAEKEKLKITRVS